MVSTPSEIDIECVCRECSERELPPQAFLFSGKRVGSLLGISVAFLEEAQQLPFAGLQLAGGAFGPDWGFSQVVVGGQDSKARFQLPALHPDDLARGNLFGYRLCVVEGDEVPFIIAELAHIRSALERSKKITRPAMGWDMTMTDL